MNEIIMANPDLIICYPKELLQLCNDLENSKEYINLNSNLDSKVFVRNGLEK